MKKLLLLIPLLLASLPTFSQTVTDTSLVVLPEPIARAVIKELLLGDAAKKELDATNIKLRLIEQKVSVKDSVILNLEKQIENFISADKERIEQLETFDEMTVRLQTDLKKEKASKKLFQASSGILIVAAIVLGVL
mgnify:CR=1 FL=1|tara:strand:+ start:1357 stop:1764 length:408 start_codon:yes stop_codon:yes gene_type:complete